MSAFPRRLAVAMAVASVLVCLPALPAGATKPDPTHRLHSAQATAAADKQRLAHARAQTASAQDRLTALAATALHAVGRSGAVLPHLHSAQAAATAARTALVTAAADADAQQKQVNDFARAIYMSGGPLTQAAIVLSARGPVGLLDRASLMGAVSQSQADTLGQLVQLRKREQTAAHVAEVATAAVARRVAHADKLRRLALVAMTNQHAIVTKLTNVQDTIAQTLATHESQVADLARQQAAAQERAKLAAQRARLAASWAQLEAAGEAMPMATKSQGRRVVKWAKRQLVFPYS